jgi:hypothetical protein
VLAYDAPAFRNASETLRARLCKQIEAAADALLTSESGAGPKVLLIDRGTLDPRYLTAGARIRGTGRSRRSIANIEALEEGLREAGVNLRVETLEGSTLAFQIALFRHADIIIAQHGAALCNMIWARPETAILEIVPEGDGITSLQNHFSELARCLGLQYRSVKQPGKHGAVDLALVSGEVWELLKSRSQ